MSPPTSIAINQLQIPPSYNVMGTQDPFDFLDSDVSITGDDCSSSCVYSIDDDFSSVSTVQHANKETGRVNQSPFLNTTEVRKQPSPSTLFSGVRRVNASFDLSLHLKLSQVSRPPEYTHLRTNMINACMISHGFCKSLHMSQIQCFVHWWSLVPGVLQPDIKN